ncbi:MAG: delta-aminolevulinic acid dehydratase [Acidimicrobiales bacterium mtb01]|nr:porphobilinogen synthase [Actinomycetota bacterium]TEX47833.1 MAG: delta-aminolevulinic acid dehydratase [Acidimicrobiales bacterium mtb01]
MTQWERPRRLRSSRAMRRLVREFRVDGTSLMQPLFVKEGLVDPVAIDGLPGVLQHGPDSLLEAVARAHEVGVGAVMIFGVPRDRDATGSGALHPDSVLASSIRSIRQRFDDRIVIAADLCLDEFTSHGHCGVLDRAGRVDNDATLEIYARMAVVLAEAGVHLLGTSGMMDGQVGAVRSALDSADRTDVGIMAYAVKYASAFYGPFRGAVESRLEGDRTTYQQDPANFREAMREVRLDVAEGADIIMVKPGTIYFDVLRKVSEMVDVPTATYIVSGETAMIEAAAASGSIDREAAIDEIITSARRAGATIICTYWATEFARRSSRDSRERR